MRLLTALLLVALIISCGRGPSCKDRQLLYAYYGLYSNAQALAIGQQNSKLKEVLDYNDQVMQKLEGPNWQKPFENLPQQR